VSRCPLCLCHDCAVHAEIGSRVFNRCGSCELVFVPREYHLSSEEEKERYALHTNSPSDRKYVDYLSAIADDALTLAHGPVSVLDFGSGGEHVLTDIINSRGVRCVAYDPLYGLTAPDERFDIVIACEVFEHLRDPRHSTDVLGRLAAGGGFVYVRTRLYDHALAGDFAGWWYAKDPTHIAFYCGETMKTVAKLLGKKVVSTNNKDTIIFQ
jgi:Methyltransferase domain